MMSCYWLLGTHEEVSEEAPARPPLSWTKLTLLVISGHLVITLQLPDNGECHAVTQIMGYQVMCHDNIHCVFHIKVLSVPDTK